MPAANDDLESSLLGIREPPSLRRRFRSSGGALVVVTGLILFVSLLGIGNDRGEVGFRPRQGRLDSTVGPELVESEVGVVAADDARCSEVGAAALMAGGHAVDAAVATALCLGVVHPMSSGIGGGGFIVVRSSGSGETEAYDARETAPLAASKNMYEKDPSSKSDGPLSMAIPGEMAGLHAAWSKHGRLPWKDLFQPAIKLARDGFLVAPTLAKSIRNEANGILADPGLRAVFAPQGKLLRANDTCYNPALAHTLEVISVEGPKAFYNGTIGEKFMQDVKNVGGIATMEDLKTYKVRITEAMAAHFMGYQVLGMPLPSSGIPGMALILNILSSYQSLDALRGPLGLHRLIESIKHMLAVRMNLGDPDFVNNDEYVKDMLSPSFAKALQQKIVDNTTFEPSYYLARWSQLDDHGTSHLCIVDADRNAVSMTTTVNGAFGAQVLSPSTGIVLNNEMDDFSVPADTATPDHLPPAPANFVEPKKRPLSSMTPIIILKDNQLAGVLGASGGMYIIPATIQVFLNHFVFGMDPLEAVRRPRVFHKLIPNVVRYENLTAIDGEHIEFSNDAKLFLEQRGHVLGEISSSAVSQLVVHSLEKAVPYSQPKERGLKKSVNVFHGVLTAVSDPRKDGCPAGL